MLPFLCFISLTHTARFTHGLPTLADSKYTKRSALLVRSASGRLWDGRVAAGFRSTDHCASQPSGGKMEEKTETDTISKGRLMSVIIIAFENLYPTDGADPGAKVTALTLLRHPPLLDARRLTLPRSPLLRPWWQEERISPI